MSGMAERTGDPLAQLEEAAGDIERAVGRLRGALVTLRARQALVEQIDETLRDTLTSSLEAASRTLARSGVEAAHVLEGVQEAAAVELRALADLRGRLEAIIREHGAEAPCAPQVAEEAPATRVALQRLESERQRLAEEVRALERERQAVLQQVERLRRGPIASVEREHGENPGEDAEPGAWGA